MPLSIVVLGPGALGRALGGVLERGGADVNYLGRGGAGPLAVPDLVLVAVKAVATEAAVHGVPRKVRRARAFLTLQNGLGNVEAIERAGVPPERILGGATTHAARRRPDGSVEHVAAGETRIAPYRPGGRALAEEMAARLTGHGLAATVEDDLGRLLWRKLAVSCGINAVTALRRLTNGELLRTPDALATAIGAAREALEIGAASGVDVDPSEARAMVSAVLERTAANRSSMLQDVEAGRETEVTFINGAVDSVARAIGHEAPQNAALTQFVLSGQRAHA